jgi:hypothetical protein
MDATPGVAIHELIDMTALEDRIARGHAQT